MARPAFAQTERRILGPFSFESEIVNGKVIRRSEATVKRPEIAIESAILGNGLQVVVAPDRGAPVVTVGVYYRIGSRLETEGRGGFAHLFEHMMFQGSANAPRTQHAKIINSSGGKFNASTSYNWTSYFEALPSNALERALWLEADRMRALKVDVGSLNNQRDVVKEEVRSNVLNQPYGSFPWLDMPAVAFRNWANAHSLYGDFEDLDAARLEDVQAFFKTYYVPNNAVLLILGDVGAEEAVAMSAKYFGDIPARPLPHFPDTAEPEQTEERCGFVEEKFGQVPALAVGYLMPKRRTTDWCAMGLLDNLLHDGKAARVNRNLVQEMQIALDAQGGIDELFGHGHLSQMTTQIRYLPGVSSQAILAAFDSVIHEVQQDGVTQEETELAKIKWRSEYFSRLEAGGSHMPRFGLMHLIACFTLFDNEPQLVNTILDEFLKVGLEDLLEAARKYLRKENRAIVYRVPVKKSGACQ